MPILANTQTHLPMHTAMHTASEKSPILYAYHVDMQFSQYQCFLSAQNRIDFADTLPDGTQKPARWTVILGENGSGKTSILRLVADATARPIHQIHMTDGEPIPKYAYGASRQRVQHIQGEKIEENALQMLNNTRIFDTENIFLNLSHASTLGSKRAKNRLETLRQLLKSILPEIQDVAVAIDDETSSTPTVFFIHENGQKLRLDHLSHGYQVVTAMMVDLANRMIQDNPDSEQPLDEPAIVLIDELDLHLHPAWQQKIIGMLDQFFKNTQFIITTHSPLIVQSCPRMNLVLLKKSDDPAQGVVIENRVGVSYLGWTIEEILREMMDLQNIRSPQYQALRQQFDEAVAHENATKAQEIYQELEPILHPSNPSRHLMALDLQFLGVNDAVSSDSPSSDESEDT